MISIILILVVAFLIYRAWNYEQKPLQEGEILSDGQDYYRHVYLKSEAWQRKRYVLLKRDNWRCRYCGGRASQVHPNDI